MPVIGGRAIGARRVLAARIAICLALMAGFCSAATASAQASPRASIDPVFAVTASGTQLITWNFHWTQAIGDCTETWSGSGSNSISFTVSKQRTNALTNSEGVAFAAVPRKKPWVTGYVLPKGQTTDAISGGASCGAPPTYPTNSCGKRLRWSAPELVIEQLFKPRNDHFVTPASDMKINYQGYECPFGTSDLLVSFYDAVEVGPATHWTMTFKDTPRLVGAVKVGKSQAFHATVNLARFKGWSAGLCTDVLNDPEALGVPPVGEGSCTVKGTLKWNIKLKRIS
jgi:hypothetical protein